MEIITPCAPRPTSFPPPLHQHLPLCLVQKRHLWLSRMIQCSYNGARLWSSSLGPAQIHWLGQWTSYLTNLCLHCLKMKTILCVIYRVVMNIKSINAQKAQRKYTGIQLSARNLITIISCISEQMYYRNLRYWSNVFFLMKE